MATYLAQGFDYHVATMGTKDKDKLVDSASLVTPFVDMMNEQAVLTVVSKINLMTDCILDCLCPISSSEV